MLYDNALTFTDEWELIWSRQFRLASFIIAVNHSIVVCVILDISLGLASINVRPPPIEYSVD